MAVISSRRPLTIISNRNHPEVNNHLDLSSSKRPQSSNNKRTSTRVRPSQATILARIHTLRAATRSNRRTLRSSTLSKIQILGLYRRVPVEHLRDIVGLPAVCHLIKTSKCHPHLAQWEKVRCRSHPSALASRTLPVKTKSCATATPSTLTVQCAQTPLSRLQITWRIV